MWFKERLISDFDQSYHRNDSNNECRYSGTHDHYLIKTGSNDWIQNNPISDADEASQIYMQSGTPLIDFTETFKWLRERSEALSEKPSIHVEPEGSTLTFKIPSSIKEGDTVYFQLDNWPDNVTDIYYEFEDTVNPPVKRDGLKLVEGNDYNEPDGSWCPTCNIVVNCGGNEFHTGNDAKLTNTYISAKGKTLPISNRPAGVDIPNAYDKVKATNNRLASEKILYNFYEAGKQDVSKKSSLKGNFNGTIFAPNADIFSADECDGHLSGALIAKSFEGGMEFGYRPYRGTSDILGATSGYAVPVDKFIKGTESKLAGAKFKVTDDITGKPVYKWTSSNETEYVNIPSAVDLTGATNYREKSPEELTIIKNYTIAEESPPTGYLGIEKEYKVTVKEVIDPEYVLVIIIDGDSKYVPQVVDVTVTIESKNNSIGKFDPFETLYFQTRDAYGETSKGLLQRKIVMKDAGGNIIDVYAINLDSNQNTALGTINTSFVDDELIKETNTEADQNEVANVSVENLTIPEISINSDNAEIPEVSDEAESVVQTDEQAEVTTTAIEETSEESTSVETVAEDVVDEPQAYAEETVDELVPQIYAEEAVDEPQVYAETTAIRYKKIKKIELARTIDQDLTSLKTSKVIDGTKYYYDCDSVMVMPLPEHNLSFENKPGLLFTKIDNAGNALTGADISLMQGSEPQDDKWEWSETSSSYPIDIDKLTEESVYSFVENNSPPGYEPADPIYFKKVDGKLYKCDANGKTGDEVDKVNNAYYAISMTDIKISGAKIKLEKWKSDYSSQLGGATFQLQASDKTPIYPLEGTFQIPETGDFDLFTTLRDPKNNGAYNSQYVNNGYLKPGTYILHEVTPPSGGYQAQDFNFKVEANNSITIIPSGTPPYYTTTIGTGQEVVVYPQNSKDEKISVSNVTKIEIELNRPTSGTLELLGGPFNGDKPTITDGKVIIDNLNNVSFDSFKIQNGTYNDGVDVKEVRIYGEEGGASGSSSSGKNIQDIICQKYDSNSTLNGTLDLTFYYGSGESQTITDTSFNGDLINTGSLNKNNVVGVKIVPKNGFIFKATVRESDSVAAFGNWWEEVSGTKEFGDCSEPVSKPEETTPPDPTTSDAPPLLNLDVVPGGDSSLIKIPNQKPGTNISITAEKIWADDTGFEPLFRPTEISVTLKRKKQVDGNWVDDEKFKKEAKITPDANGDWIPATWSGLERLVDENGADEESNWYKYYVVENPVSNYQISYSENNTSGLSTNGTITITNTLKTTNITVNKKWLNSDGTENNSPEGSPSVTVKLQWRDKGSSAGFTDVPGKTLTLRAPDYSETFEKLPTNKEYQVIESYVPNGWTWDEVPGNEGTNYTINNTQDVGKIIVKKNWADGNNTSQRPENIYLKLIRTIKPTAATSPSFDPNLSNPYPDYNSAVYTNNGITQQNDYARLLQYSLYFYDANMCGDQVNETSAYSWREDCHTSDEVKGGFHDAGDHVMFGLPQGFSASTLGWSYNEFKDSFDNLGLTDHYKDIMKYFCDFFVASTEMSNGNVSRLLVEKGEGNTDHSYWGPPESQPNDKRGRLEWTTNGGSNIAADYAAALAQYYLNFPNAPESSNYLEYAKALYKFSTQHNSTYSVSFYADNECNSEQAWAAAWLYLATNEKSYKTACKTKLDLNPLSRSNERATKKRTIQTVAFA